MNGVHDMGGMHGFGPIDTDETGPLFHHDWERRVFAMRVASPIPIPGGSRNNIEQMNPADYLKSSYYEKWLQSRLKGFIDADVLTEAEIEERVAHYRQHPHEPTPQRQAPAQTQQTMQRLLSWQSPRRDRNQATRYTIGETVLVRNLHPPGHTRLPQYVRDKSGIITRYYGIYDLQDAMPDGSEPPAEPLYAVRFDCRDLWGDSAEANSGVYLDMWESYLNPFVKVT